MKKMRLTFLVDHRSEPRSLHQGSIATRSQPGEGKKGRTSRSRKMTRKKIKTNIGLEVAGRERGK